MDFEKLKALAEARMASPEFLEKVKETDRRLRDQLEQLRRDCEVTPQQLDEPVTI